MLGRHVPADLALPLILSVLPAKTPSAEELTTEHGGNRAHSHSALSHVGSCQQLEVPAKYKADHPNHQPGLPPSPHWLPLKMRQAFILVISNERSPERKGKKKKQKKPAWPLLNAVPTSVPVPWSSEFGTEPGGVGRSQPVPQTMFAYPSSTSQGRAKLMESRNRTKKPRSSLSLLLSPSVHRSVPQAPEGRLRFKVKAWGCALGSTLRASVGTHNCRTPS